MKHSTIFKSRWWAVLWAGGIVWFAVQVSSPDSPSANDGANAGTATDVLGQPIDQAQTEELLNQAIAIN